MPRVPITRRRWPTCAPRNSPERPRWPAIFPSLSLNADYGVGGAHPSDATPVADVRGTLTIPIFQGGSVHGDVLQADARLEQSRERLENLRAQIDSDVRTALLNLQSSADLVQRGAQQH